MQLLCIVHLRICCEWQTVSCIPRFEFKRQRLFYWQRDNRWILMRSVAAIRSTLGCPLTGAATHASCSLAAQDTDTRSSRYDYLGSKQRRLLLARLDAWMVGWMDGWMGSGSLRTILRSWPTANDAKSSPRQRVYPRTLTLRPKSLDKITRCNCEIRMATKIPFNEALAHSLTIS